MRARTAHAVGVVQDDSRNLRANVRLKISSRRFPSRLMERRPATSPAAV